METLVNAEYENVVGENMEQYISALHSIKDDVNLGKIQAVINDYN